MSNKPDPEKVKKAIELAKRTKPSAFNPVLKERDMARQAQEDGAHGANMLIPGEDSHGQS